MDTDRAYITLREVVDDIAYDFKYRQNLPVPQQSSVLNADQMPFALNVNANSCTASSEAPAPERKSAARKHNAKIYRVGFATVFAAALTFFVFKSVNHGDNHANHMENPVVSVVSGDKSADSLFNRYIYMASRYLEGGDFDPEDFKDCIAKAEAIKSGDAKVQELNRRFEATYRGRE